MVIGKMGRAGAGLLIITLIAFIVSGCGLFGPEKKTEPIDPPQMELGNVNEAMGEQTGLGEDSSSVVAGEQEFTEKVLYLLDPNGYVVPVTMMIPYKEGIAKQVLTYMVKGGPVEEMLPTGFQAVLPAGTKFEISIANGAANVDFSKEFKNYEAKDEKKILEAVTWALTEFPTVNKVNIWINGTPVETMPVAKTPVGEGLSRADGINLEMAQSASPGSTSAVTLYFEGETPTGDLRYFVPVTRLVPRTDNLANATLQELIKGPAQGSGLVTSLLPTTKVLDARTDNGVAVADFDEMILGFDSTASRASAYGLQSVVLSLAASTGASKVQVMVNGKAQSLTDTIDFSQPVAVPKGINRIEY